MNGEIIAFSHLRCDEAAEILGIWMDPNGNRKKLISVINARAVEWGDKKGKLSRKEAWTALHTNISTKLKHSVPDFTLTEKEFKSIIYPAFKAALPKSRISGVMTTEIRDGPAYTGGSEVLSLYHYMGTSRTFLLVEQLFRDTSLGNIISVCIEVMVLDAVRYETLCSIPFPNIS